jgi:hypothetical protein
MTKPKRYRVAIYSSLSAKRPRRVISRYHRNMAFALQALEQYALRLAESAEERGAYQLASNMRAMAMTVNKRAGQGMLPDRMPWIVDGQVYCAEVMP